MLSRLTTFLPFLHVTNAQAFIAHFGGTDSCFSFAWINESFVLQKQHSIRCFDLSDFVVKDFVVPTGRLFVGFLDFSTSIIETLSLTSRFNFAPNDTGAHRFPYFSDEIPKLSRPSYVYHHCIIYRP